MIRAENLYKQYAGRKVLHGLSLSVENGCVLGFIGPNGAGKTTTMRILCGIMPPTAGAVSISGIDMIRDPIRAKTKLGYLPENAPLPPGMSVHAFLTYCGRMRGLYGNALKTAVDRSVERCRLNSVLYEDVESLSKGFRRRTCLAQSMMHDPENLVLDEPTDGLDPDQKREIRTLIRELREHSAIIVSTHILEEIDEVCDQVLAIRSGREVFSGTTEDFRNLLPDSNGIRLLLKEYPETIRNDFEEISGVRKISVENTKDGVQLKIYPEKNVSSAELLGKFMNHPGKVLKAETFSAKPAEIFAHLGDRKGEENQ